MSTSTTTAPAEPGTTYPMPPGPVWATERRMEEDAVTHQHCVGTFELEPLTSTDVDTVERSSAVILSRWDMITDEYLTVGSTSVCVLDTELTPAGARVLAALLIEAADLAGQS